LSYPFENNPFEEYFKQLRNERKNEHDFLIMLNSDKLPINIRAIYVEKLKNTLSKIKTLIDNVYITPRSYDIYLGQLDLAIEKLQRDFPEPCDHKVTDIRLREFSDQSTHIVTQCLTCGRAIKDHKKSDIHNISSISEFEEGLRRKEEIAYQRWWSLHNEIVERINGEDGKRHEFNYDVFVKNYEKKHPKPFTSNECKHKSTKLTTRIYSPKNTTVVSQCTQCGKHLNNIPKNKVKNIQNLPPFDLEVEQQLWDEFLQWNKAFSEQCKLAKGIFYEDISSKIASGEITRIDKSTFGTYYDTEEWRKTRIRIFSRDDNECQACQKHAQCVHHLTYERLGKENDIDLISLCSRCHNIIHEIQDSKWYGYKLTPNEIQSIHRHMT